MNWGESRRVTYIVSAIVCGLLIGSLAQYPVKYSDQNNAGCIVKYSYNSSAFGADGSYSGIADYDTTWKEEFSWKFKKEDKIKDELRHDDEDVMLSGRWMAAMVLLSISLAGCLVHAFEANVIEFPEELRSFFNILFGITFAAGFGLYFEVMSGGTCMLLAPGVDGNVTKDFSDRADASWNLGVVALAIEVVLFLFGSMVVSPIWQFPASSSMLSDLNVHTVVRIVAIFAFVVLYGGSAALKTAEPDVTGLRDACRAFDHEHNELTEHGNSSHPDNYADLFKNNDARSADAVLWSQGILAVVLGTLLLVEVMLVKKGSGTYGEMSSMNDNRVYFIFKVLLWSAFVVMTGVLFGLWMTASKSACVPLYTSNHAVFGAPMMYAGFGSILGIGFISRGLKRAEGPAVESGSQRPTLGSGMTMF